MINNTENTKVILIGISDYEYSDDFHNLSSALDNITELRKLFSNHLGIPSQNIKYFVNSKNKQEIEIEILNSNQEDIIIYYSGHGCPGENTLYLSMSNSSQSNILITGIKIDEINSLILKFKKVILILDCCFGARAFKYLQNLQHTILASSQKESSYNVNQKFSEFTKHLLDIIKKGINSTKEYLSLQDVFNEIKVRLLENGDPEPKIQDRNQCAELDFCKNRYGLVLDEEKSIINYLDIQDEINQNLLTSSFFESAVPKLIDDIFVDPPMYNLPEGKKTSNQFVKQKYKDENRWTIDKILNSTDHLFIYGDKESGKTTLVYYLISKIISNSVDLGGHKSIPCFLNFDDINPNNNNSVEHNLRKFLNVNSDNIKRILTNENCIIFIDNFKWDKQRNKILFKFNSQYSKHRFIITQDYYNDISIDSAADVDALKMPFEFKKVYIYPFGQKEVSKYIENWFSNSNKNVTEIKEKIINLLNITQIPKNPLNITFLVSIFETSKNYRLIVNKSVLVEEFINTILEKSNFRNSSVNLNTDFREQEYYLSYIAGYMTNEGIYQCPYSDLCKITDNFFKSFGHKRVDSKRLIEYMTEKGIFQYKDNTVSFKMDCFKEYFTAKQMIEDEDFYQYILSEERYLDFITVFDYLTGIQRKNKDLIEIISERLRKTTFEEETQSKIDLNTYATFDTEENWEFKSEEIVEIFNKTQNSMNNDYIDIIKKDGDDVDISIDEELDINFDDQVIVKDNAFQNRNLYSKNLKLLSILIKNCDFVKPEYKNIFFQEAIMGWSKFFITSILYFEKNFIEDKIIEIINNLKISSIDNEFSQKEILEYINTNKKEINDVMKMTFPFLFQRIIKEYIGSEKLEDCILHTLKINNKLIVQFILVNLYIDLRLTDYTKIALNFYESIKHNKSLVMQLYFKLMANYMFSENMKEKEKTNLEELLGEIHCLHMNGRLPKNKNEAGQIKTQFKDYLRKNRMANYLN